MSNSRPFFTSRSSQVLYQKCPRLRFWNSIYGKRGIQPIEPSLDMELGSAIHEGVASLLDTGELEQSLEAAALSLSTALGSFYPASLVNTYRQLTEGLLRAFYALWYPRLRAKFQVVGKAEQEMSAWLNGEEAGIVHMSRPDAVLRDKASGEYGVWSVKTTSFADDSELELEYRTDTQGMAEMWAAEKFFEAKMSWSQLFVIHTGAKEKTEDGPIHVSPAYQGWYKDDGLGSVQLAHSYWWKDGQGKRRGLGQAWKRFAVAEMYEGGIAGWITDLAAGKIQPEAGNPLEGLFFLPPAFYRREETIEEWRKSTLYQEDRIKVSSNAYHDEAVSEENKDFILLDTFPQHRSSCIYMRRKCSFYQLCHGTAGEQDDPFSHGFKWREINHPQEKEKK